MFGPKVLQQNAYMIMTRHIEFRAELNSSVCNFHKNLNITGGQCDVTREVTFETQRSTSVFMRRGLGKAEGDRSTGVSICRISLFCTVRIPD